MNSKPNMLFLNRSFDKKRLKALLLWFRLNLSENAALKAVEILQGLGFRSATQGAISLGLDDLKTPTSKSGRVFQAQVEVALAHHEHHRGNRTPVELFQHLVDTWHRTSQDLTTEVVQLFHSTERVNPVYMMAFSGARGNISQVRQLVGMRGLMADPRGQIVGFPILSNFREGLTITEYFVSCYGARKGVVDTAIRTADAGYLTRRLADVSHHVVVRTTNCGTHESILLRDIKEGQKTILSLANRLVGRVLAEHVLLPANLTQTLPYPKGHTSLGLAYQYPEGIKGMGKKQELYYRSTSYYPEPALQTKLVQQGKPSIDVAWQTSRFTPSASITSEACTAKQAFFTSKSLPLRGTADEMNVRSKEAEGNYFGEDKTKIIIYRNSEITFPLASKLAIHYLEVPVRSPLSCSLPWGVCQLCYGWGLSEGRRVTLGEAVGIIAAQSIGEPGTQLTLRTFHTGGVFSGELLNEIRAPYNGNVIFPTPLQGLLLRTPHGQIAFLTKVSGKMKIFATEMHFASKKENVDTSISLKKGGFYHELPAYPKGKQVPYVQNKEGDTPLPHTSKALKGYRGEMNAGAKERGTHALLRERSVSYKSKICTTQHSFHPRGVKGDELTQASLKVCETKEQKDKLNHKKNELGLPKQDSEFFIQPSTVIFVKQKEHVISNQLLAEFSSSTLQSVNDQIEITQQVLSETAGQIWFKELEYGNRKGPGSGSLGTYFSSQKLGGIWVLAGKPMIDIYPSFARPLTNSLPLYPCTQYKRSVGGVKGYALTGYSSNTQLAKDGKPSVLAEHEMERNVFYKSKICTTQHSFHPRGVKGHELVRSNPSKNVFTNTNVLLHGKKIRFSNNWAKYLVFNNFVLSNLGKVPKINESFLKRKNLFKYHTYSIQNRLKRSINTRYAKTCTTSIINLQNNYGILKYDYVLGYSQAATSKKHYSASVRLAQYPLPFQGIGFLLAKRWRGRAPYPRRFDAPYLRGVLHSFHPVNAYPFTPYPFTPPTLRLYWVQKYLGKEAETTNSSPFPFWHTLFPRKGTNASLVKKQELRYSVRKLNRSAIAPLTFHVYPRFAKGSLPLHGEMNVAALLPYDESFEKTKNEIKKSTLLFQELCSSESNLTFMQNKTPGSKKKFDMLPLLSESDLVTFVTNYGDNNRFTSNHTQCKRNAVQPLMLFQPAPYPFALYPRGVQGSNASLVQDETNVQIHFSRVAGKEAKGTQLFPGQLVAYGDNIASNMVTTESGQVLYIDSQKTTLRKAQTVLIYSQAIIAVLSGDWIKKGTPLMSLSYQKLVTGDIVQGLPKIEQFFEAPVLRDGTFWSDSLQAKLNQFFQEEREKLPLAEAVRKGFSEIQRVLVEGVLRVYISQGVLIADKHLEVIVRQMTCKGRILYSGDTGFLRNELVSLDKIENVNQVTYGQKALYHPQVRGITDASLESESFLSAASFQETTRVLSRDAIIGKTDLMRGLKERVIVGELIQAGTGLANNSVYNLLTHSFTEY